MILLGLRHCERTSYYKNLMPSVRLKAVDLMTKSKRTACILYSWFSNLFWTTYKYFCTYINITLLIWRTAHCKMLKRKNHLCHYLFIYIILFYLCYVSLQSTNLQDSESLCQTKSHHLFSYIIIVHTFFTSSPIKTVTKKLRSAKFISIGVNRKATKTYCLL